MLNISIKNKSPAPLPATSPHCMLVCTSITPTKTPDSYLTPQQHPPLRPPFLSLLTPRCYFVVWFSAQIRHIIIREKQLEDKRFSSTRGIYGDNGGAFLFYLWIAVFLVLFSFFLFFCFFGVIFCTACLSVSVFTPQNQCYAAGLKG